jgi:ankyrin repeat protein
MLLHKTAEMTFTLARLGAPLTQVDPFGCQPLHIAARQGNLDWVVALCLLNAPINATGLNQWYVS